jgi:dTDP-4-amino-4,6-dideoxygalactose transaminase
MIAVFDAARNFRAHREEYLAAFERVLSSNRLILGPETEAFETEFAAHVKSAHAVGVNSGTDALVLAMTALGVGLGDEVLVPALTAPATAAAVRMVGAVPRFVDVLPDALTMDPQAADRAVTRRTRCILPVHLYGAAAEMTQLAALAESRGLALVEDCAQAHGTMHAGRTVGTFGRIGCYSFYPTKNLGAFGDGGACVTDDPYLAQRLRRLRFYGLDADGVMREDGRNSRLDELQAALLRVKLRWLEKGNLHRRVIAERYRRNLRDADLRLPIDQPGCCYHQFVIRTADRAGLIAELQRHQIGYGVHYPRPLHLMPAYEFLGYRAGDLPVAEQACDEVLSLPIYPELDNIEVDRVCTAVLRGLRMADVHSATAVRV